MKRKKRTIFLIILILGILSFSLYAPNQMRVSADSGWDTDYGGGGGDYGGGNNWDSGSTSSGIGNSDGLMGIFMAITIVLIVVALFDSKKKGCSTPQSYSTKTYIDLSDEEIKAVDDKLDPLQFKGQAFLLYKDIQTAWMNFDYKTLRNLLTDELYNSYKSQLEALSLKGQKNMMIDINMSQTKIIGIKEENGVISIDVYLAVECYDYVVDAKDKVIRGNKQSLLGLEYELTFTKVTEETDGVICPQCGHKTSIVTSGQCEYCRSKIVALPQSYVMSKKKMVNQRVVK